MKNYLVPAAALAIVGALVAAPTAASAATLPDGQSLYGYGYGEGFFSVNPSTAFLTLIGSGTFQRVYGIDYSEQDAVAYFFIDNNPCEFYSLDIATGIETDIGPIMNGIVEIDNCDALDVAPDGTVYVGSTDTIYEINTTDGSVSVAHVLSGDPLDGELGFLATDPTTGILYVGDYSGNFFSVDKTTWAATFVGTAGEYIESGDFDANGVFWFSGDGSSGQGLNSLVLSDPGTITRYGDFATAGGPVDLYGIFVYGTAAPKPALAATGTDAGGLLPVGIGAGILLLAGAGAIFFARRRAAS